jgi:hypothetical protein
MMMTDIDIPGLHVVMTEFSYHLEKGHLRSRDDSKKEFV